MDDSNVTHINTGSKMDKITMLEMELDNADTVDTADRLAYLQAQIQIEICKVLQEISNSLVLR